MKNIDIIKRLYKDYTKKHLNKIVLAVIFSIFVAGSTSATAWLLDPAIEKIFINKDQSLILVIPFLIILAFSTKGISLYLARILMIKTAEEVKKNIQIDMLSSFIKADTEAIEEKHSGKYISNLNFDVNQITGMLSNSFLRASGAFLQTSTDRGSSTPYHSSKRNPAFFLAPLSITPFVLKFFILESNRFLLVLLMLDDA